MDAGEEVGERVLEGERDGEAAHAERGEDRGDVDPEDAQKDEDADDEDRHARRGLREAGDRSAERAPLAREADEGRHD